MEAQHIPRFLDRLAIVRPHLTAFFNANPELPPQIEVPAAGPGRRFRLALPHAKYPQEALDETDRQVDTDKPCLVIEGDFLRWLENLRPRYSSNVTKDMLATVGAVFCCDPGLLAQWLGDAWDPTGVDMASVAIATVIESVGYMVELQIGMCENNVMIDLDEAMTMPYLFWLEPGER